MASFMLASLPVLGFRWSVSDNGAKTLAFAFYLDTLFLRKN
jgi:hypothetical protein